jgi:hypothetical protein
VAATDAVSPPAATQSKRRQGADDDPVVQAQTVTFFIDNQDCPGPVEVNFDGTLLGEAAGGTRAAFQALAGRHMVCLLESGTDAECGGAGTVCTAFIFDGWTVTMHCAGGR